MNMYHTHKYRRTIPLVTWKYLEMMHIVTHFKIYQSCLRSSPTQIHALKDLFFVWRRKDAKREFSSEQDGLRLFCKCVCIMLHIAYKYCFLLCLRQYWITPVKIDNRYTSFFMLLLPKQWGIYRRTLCPKAPNSILLYEPLWYATIIKNVNKTMVMSQKI